ncbi:hypothetical protein Hdeb2414_s0012g00378811 [Helianthus debilis subsp. tardiflorus]
MIYNTKNTIRNINNIFGFNRKLNKRFYLSDQYVIAAVKRFVKLSVKAKDVIDVPDCVFSVIDHAGSGGCYLDIPSDVLHQTLTELEANKLLDDTERNRKLRVYRMMI